MRRLALAVIQHVVHPSPRDRAWAAAVALFVIANLFYHGAQPYAVGAVPAPWDKPVHMLLFFVLGTLAWVAFGGRRFWVVLLMCALVAGTDELAQLMNPGRDVELTDWLADVAGVALAGFVLAQLRARSMRGGTSRR
jgi:VanZ family protein